MTQKHHAHLLSVVASIVGATLSIKRFQVTSSNVVIGVECVSLTPPRLWEASSPGGPWHVSTSQGWLYDWFAWDWVITLPRGHAARFYKATTLE